MLKMTLRSIHFDRRTSIWKTFSRMYSPGILGRSGDWLSNNKPFRSFWYCPWQYMGKSFVINETETMGVVLLRVIDHSTEFYLQSPIMEAEI